MRPPIIPATMGSSAIMEIFIFWSRLFYDAKLPYLMTIIFNKCRKVPMVRCFYADGSDESELYSKTRLCL